MKNPFKIDKADLILDKNKIRNCTKNCDKMSIWENMIFDCKGCIKQFCSFYVTSLKDIFTGLIRLLWVLFCTLTFPIILFIRAIITKHKARKEIEMYESTAKR